MTQPSKMPFYLEGSISTTMWLTEHYRRKQNSIKKPGEKEGRHRRNHYWRIWYPYRGPRVGMVLLSITNRVFVRSITGAFYVFDAI